MKFTAAARATKAPSSPLTAAPFPRTLLESELFGHVKGAFTGAVATKQGKFQAAIGGTLFLDEIGEMPLQLQVKLLRALQEKVVYKVGDNRPEPVDIRIVAATNKNLDEETRKKGTFREDLYFRINVVTLKLPPLRDRGDDLVVLAKFFLAKSAKEFNAKAKGFTPAATVSMKKYHWPGNIRELENRLKKAVVLADKPLLTPEDLDLRPENLDPIMPLVLAKERVPEAVHQRGARAKQRQPHQDGEGLRGRPPYGFSSPGALRGRTPRSTPGARDRLRRGVKVLQLT